MRTKTTDALTQRPKVANVLATISGRVRMAAWPSQRISKKDVALVRRSHLFDDKWYLERNFDVAAAGIDPLEHYFRHGASERRDPSAYFSTEQYFRMHPGLIQSNVNPLIHFIRNYKRVGGRLEGLSDYELLKRCPLFDTAWYQEKYEKHQTYKGDPIAHYLAFGASEKCEPGPLFDSSYYAERHPDVARARLNPLVDAIKNGRIYPSPRGAISRDEFNEDWYRKEYPSVAAENTDLFRHFVEVGQIQGRHPHFNAKWYLEEYPDVARALIDPLDHYRAHGRNEGRHPGFSHHWYLAEYPDVAASGLEPLEHYKRLGRKEGRHPSFHGGWYLDQYRDVFDAGVDPYTHYMTNGRGEGRQPAFSRFWYSAEYQDVSLHGTDPYKHYFRIGKVEGRHVNHQDIRRTRAKLTDFGPAYDSEYQAQEEFGSLETDIKAVAFYLPQFHRSPANDIWWGEGFTEWTNTRRAKPCFEGHYQPREPHDDIGYYDLAEVESLRKQAKIARQHGIYGFCFYHYWFSGERVLEKPLDVLIDNPDIDIKFCICWANENWTKVWDGNEKDVLIGQNYSEGDPEQFIRDSAKYLLDERYIKIDGAPVIMVYKAHLIPNVRNVFGAWRLNWKLKTGQDLVIWCNRTNPSDHRMAALDAPFDATVEFPPHVIPDSSHLYPYLMDQHAMHLDTSGNLFDYRALVEDITEDRELSPLPTGPFYRSVMLGWDNSARRSEGWSAWYGFALSLYYDWLKKTVEYTRENFEKEKRFVFINAWNEWAEGTYLEPDRKCGYANLNTTSRALFGLPFTKQIDVFGRKRVGSHSKQFRIAVHLHVFFEDTIDEMLFYLNQMPTSFDLFITSDTEAKINRIKNKCSILKSVDRQTFICSPNIGRDVGPFLLDVAPRLQEYDLVGHFHSKKSTTVEWGNRWRRYLFQNLLGTSDGIQGIFDAFAEDRTLGLVYPPAYPLIADHINWSGLRPRVESLLNRVGLHPMLPAEPRFPAGNMFWARVDAVAPVLTHEWVAEDFEQEAGQIEQTLGHCVERIWEYVVAARGYRSCTGLLERRKEHAACVSDKKRLTLFVHYDPRDVVDAPDLFFLAALRKISTRLVVATNSNISASDERAIRCYADTIIRRENKGLDFGAWRDLIRVVKWTNLVEYDEVIIANNSCYGPIFPLTEMFSSMESVASDFWGISDFPETQNSIRPEAALLKDRNIPAHIQSYFVVFKKQVVRSGAFFDFWEGVVDKSDFMDVVTSYEVTLTDRLVQSGFSSAVYTPEAGILQKCNEDNPRYNAVYNRPLDMIFLRTPLIKKRAWDYAPNSMTRAQELLKEIPSYLPHLVVRR